MLIRASGYNTGAQEYLEQGNKSGREFTRDELDHRLILDGQLSVTREIYESIPNHGQDRYLTFTMSFKEDHVEAEVLKSITSEFKQFLMHAYKSEEFNFYAEAHLPKIKEIKDKKTGEMIERKPHVHIIIPRINLLSGNEANPVDVYMKHEKYFEAFQEYINQKYGLASPRENVRANIEDAASVLSRYKADDFYGKNRAFKQNLVTEVINRGINTRADFYSMVAEYGETRIRNEGKDNEYLAVKLPGDAKSTNLKETIFQDEFIVRRSLTKPPLDPAVIQLRLHEWRQRSKEIKYIHKMASPAFRERYWDASPEDRVSLLAEREQKFYQTYGGHNDDKFISSPRDHQRGTAEAQYPRHSEPAYGVSDVSFSDVAGHGQAEPARQAEGSLLLPGDAYVHLGQQHEGGDRGLRLAVPGGRRGRARAERRGPEQPATVPAPTARERKSGSERGSVRSPRRVRPVGSDELPPDARNPHRVRSMDDIEQRGRRLFGAASDPAAQSGLVHASSSDPAFSGQRASGKKKRRFKAVDPLPPHARNPHRVGSMSDIKARSRRLFDSSGPVDPARLVKRPSIKPLLINRRASTVAAYFTRQAEQNQLMPAQRHALRRVNKQYFDLRRSVFSDPRLTRQDKTQLVSVLTFERLKAREAIQNPQYNVEAFFMGSAEIRKLINDDEKEAPEFSITGPGGPGSDRREPEGVRVRVKRVLDTLSKRLDPAEKVRDLARERELNAKDLYTRKAKFSQNVHYLDKTTNKTLFVDTGKAIALRRTGITESGVAVALQLAKERFGSTLTINGTAEFKSLVIDAVAKGNMDIHFTDKAMNDSLTARRAELEIEREGEVIEPAATPEPASPATAPAAPVVQADPSFILEREAEWRKTMRLSEAEVLSSSTVMQLRGEDHAIWLVASNDQSQGALTLLTSYMQNDSYRDSFKSTIEGLYAEAADSPEALQGLEPAMSIAERIVNSVERGLSSTMQDPAADMSKAVPASTQAVVDRKIIQGKIIEHGAAPYKYDEKNEVSYFVSLQTEAGPRTLWGVGLQDVLKDFAQGDQIKLRDGGQQTVTIQVRQEDGSVKETPGFRRVWSAELETTVSATPSNADRAATSATTAQSVSAPQAAEEVRPLIAIEARSEAFKDAVETVGIEEARSQVTPQVAREWVSADVKDIDALQGPSLKALAVEVIGENVTNAPHYGVELQVQAPEINARLADPAPSIEATEPPAAPKAPLEKAPEASPVPVVSSPAIAPEAKSPAVSASTTNSGPVAITPEIETALIGEWVTNQRDLLNQRVEMESTVRTELVSALSGKRAELKQENTVANQSKPFAERLAAVVGLGYGVNDHAIMQLNTAMRELSRKTGEPQVGRESFIETATTQRNWDEYAIKTWNGAVGMNNREDSIKPLAAWMQEQIKTRVTPQGELLPAQPKPALSPELLDRLSVERAERIGKIVGDVANSDVDYRTIAKVAFSEVGESIQSLQKESAVNALDQSRSAKTALDNVLDKPVLVEPQSYTAALSEPEQDHGPEMD